MTKSSKASVLLALATTALSCISCGGPLKLDNYARAVQSGFKKIPESMQIEDCFGEADHFISYSGPNVPRDWNTEAFFYGRYTLTMQVEVKTDSAFSEITEVVGEPKFYLREVREILRVPDGTPSEARFAGEWRFGKDDWKKVHDAKGDFSVIGIAIKKDQPVQDFEGYAKAVKEPRIRVRPGDE